LVHVPPADAAIVIVEKTAAAGTVRPEPSGGVRFRSEIDEPAGDGREDLERAGLGSGRHSFEFTPPAGLAFAADAVEVRRSLDGAALRVQLRRSEPLAVASVTDGNSL
jgi:hypothetical protein